MSGENPIPLAAAAAAKIIATALKGKAAAAKAAKVATAIHGKVAAKGVAKAAVKARAPVLTRVRMAEKAGAKARVAHRSMPEVAMSARLARKAPGVFSRAKPIAKRALIQAATAGAVAAGVGKAAAAAAAKTAAAVMTPKGIAAVGAGYLAHRYMKTEEKKAEAARARATVATEMARLVERGKITPTEADAFMRSVDATLPDAMRRITDALPWVIPLAVVAALAYFFMRR